MAAFLEIVTMRQWMAYVNRRLLLLESIVAAFCYVIAAGLLIFEVIARNVFSTGWYGAENLAVLLSVWAGFLGLVLATAHNSHLRIEALDAVIPPRWAPLLIMIGHWVSAIIYFLLAWYGIDLVMQSMEFGDLIGNLPLPMWLFQVVVPWSLFSAGLRHIFHSLYPELLVIDSLTEAMEE